jgi:hypothetical protein
MTSTLLNAWISNIMEHVNLWFWRAQSIFNFSHYYLEELVFEMHCFACYLHHWIFFLFSTHHKRWSKRLWREHYISIISVMSNGRERVCVWIRWVMWSHKYIHAPLILKMVCPILNVVEMVRQDRLLLSRHRQCVFFIFEG